MLDEQEAIASPELETTIEEPQDPTTNDNLTEEEIQPEETLEAEGAGAEPEVEYAEIERNGKKYQVPKELESEFLMQADYTKKTQATAAREKELAAREERVTQQAQFTEEELTERATLVNVSNELQKYQNVDWDALENEDPMSAQKHWRTFQTLQQQYGQLNHNLGQRQEHRTREAQQDIAKRIEETRSFAQKEIPGWSPEVDNKILDFTQTMGISKEAIVQAMNPQVYKVLHLAWVGSQALNKSATAPKPTTTVPPKPLTTVSAKGGTVSKDIADMNMDEYAAHRRKQMANKR
mgnify:CR=1 FL=1